MASSSSKTRKVEDILEDFPKGPLTPYRNEASFDWKKLKVALEDESTLFYKHDLWTQLQSDPLFHRSTDSLSLEETRYIAAKRNIEYKSRGLMLTPEVVFNPKIAAANCESLYMYDVSSAVKLSLSVSLFCNVIRSLGTDKHYKYIEAIENDEINGCFALTEVAHGSNAKGMKTTATFDTTTKEFIMHSCDFTAAKCWVGNLGQCATHAAIYAKLITNGQDHGLHAFVVPIRCNKTLRPLPGVIVGDMGEKIALNGIDNGFVMFNNYRIPRDALLNKLADVSDAGEYLSPIKDPNKRFGASLGALSGGRVFITGLATNNIQKAITIAIRYSAVRQQFGPENSNEEFAVLEYQQQQFRLIPYIAATYALRLFYNWFSETHIVFSLESAIGPKDDNTALKGMEIHALSSSSKPIAAWLARDGVQICREACGGHGYLKAAGLGDIRNENDANCTYEGENSILIQQTSNWLLSLLKSVQKGEKVVCPLNTANYLNNFNTILKSRANFSNVTQATDPKNLLDAYKWLVCHMLKLTSEKAASLVKEGKDGFTVRNETQSFYATTLSMVYCEHTLLNHFYNTASGIEDRNCKQVMLQLVSLYGSWSLEKHLSTLYMGGYLSDGNSGYLLREGIINLCKNLKSEAVTLVDTIAPPDFVLNSILGSSDGNVYQNIQQSFFSHPGSLTRPDWWKQIVKWDTTVTSKL